MSYLRLVHLDVSSKSRTMNSRQNRCFIQIIVVTVFELLLILHINKHMLVIEEEENIANLQQLNLHKNLTAIGECRVDSIYGNCLWQIHWVGSHQTYRYIVPVVEYTLSWDNEKFLYDKNHWTKNMSFNYLPKTKPQPPSPTTAHPPLVQLPPLNSHLSYDPLVKTSAVSVYLLQQL